MLPKTKKAPEILLEIDIATEYSGWDKCGFDMEALINKACRAALENSDLLPHIKHKTGEISVVLCDDEFIRKLNKDYRGKDNPTNVLSFPQIDFDKEVPAEDFLIIGDIILAHGTIAREAEEQNKSFKDHFTHLIVHGTLHLLGYDHKNAAEAKNMEELEISILKQIGIENPYSDINFMA